MGDAEWCACRGETGHTELSGTLRKQKTAQRGGNVSGQERVSTRCPTSSAGVTNLARDDSVRTHLAFNFHFIVTFAVIKNNKEFLNLSNKYNLFCGSTFSPRYRLSTYALLPGVNTLCIHGAWGFLHL